MHNLFDCRTLFSQAYFDKLASEIVCVGGRLVLCVGVCVLRVCMSFKGGWWGWRQDGDDGLDLITGWNGWKGLRCSAFTIVHSCAQAGAGSTATGGPPPEGSSRRRRRQNKQQVRTYG